MVYVHAKLLNVWKVFQQSFRELLKEYLILDSSSCKLQSYCRYSVGIILSLGYLFVVHSVLRTNLISKLGSLLLRLIYIYEDFETSKKCDFESVNP